MDSKDKIIIDLDNTITIDESSDDYTKKDVNREILKAINIAKKESINVTIFSARNMNSFDGNIEKINSITKPIAIEWLNKKNVHFDEIIFGKPWAGKDGWYVDDRNLSLEEFIFRFSGPFFKKSFDIVIPFFNEEENILKTYRDTKLLERIIDIKNYLFIDNGSSDGSNKTLNKISKNDKKVKIINIKNNIGYGNGIKEGLLASTSEFVIINHADGQFNAYNFIMSNSDMIDEHTNAIIPIRLNRSLINNICSFFLRLLLSIISFKKISDFNGQPKILRKSMIKKISSLPSDFCIDFAIYRIFEDNFQRLPIIEKKREYGTSSWNKNFFKWVKIFLRYLSYAMFFSKKLHK
jgi:capsule biosynthesis phosphatase